MKKQIVLLSTLTLLFSLGACSEAKPEESLSSSVSEIQDVFSFEKKEITLSEDTVIDVQYTANAKVVFESDDPNVAEISGKKLLAKNPGVTSIKGKAGKASDMMVVKVLQKEESADSILLSKRSEVFSLENPESYQIEASFENKTDASFSYKSLAPEIASVSETGLVTPLKEGKAEIEISVGEVKESFLADVYTKEIKNTADWLGILGNLGAYDDRYYLSNDIDFSGVSYLGYKLASDWEDDKLAFSSEVNGFGHSLKNITMGKVVDGHQSLFGWILAAKIENIAFENVVYTSTEDYARFAGIATYAMHSQDKGLRGNEISNVYLDLHFPDTGAERTGFFGNAYDYEIKNCFVSMKTISGKPFNKGRDALINAYNYFWIGKGIVSSSLFLIDNILPTLSSVGKGESSGEMEFASSYVTTEEMDAIASAYDTLGKESWEFFEEDLPKLKVLL